MAGEVAVRPKGRCPACGRVISGRAVGSSRVALRPHNRQRDAARPEACLTLGGRRVVPRIGDDAG